ncbi:MarR family transcriptional regulator [Neorhizobium sp. P12A]|uniref:MarR family winged helix-turn-helix transcriptional regulator n=1 Tax=Neorhizobium sp. P12A TaxID=2268027 RepID=UPI0011F00AA4|nr:MarR family transcriptional regulator [Neorhizobium sp. P12A]KAA0698822.1 MarR family transcriptional regulator [Neorhizobium sp. P12A]
MANHAELSDLETHLGYWLRYVSNHVSHAFSRKVEGKGVTVAEWVMLRQLYGREGTIPSALADELGMTRGAISKLADRLIAKSLITKSLSDEDRRFQSLSLTQAGSALVPEIARLADENDAEFFDHLAPDERELVTRVMKDIVRRRGLSAVPVE